MRPRILHQLIALLVGMSLLLVGGIALWLAWNLKSGFSDYLRERDRQQLQLFAKVVADKGGLGQGGQPSRGLPMRELMDEFLVLQGDAVSPPPDRRGPPRPAPDSPADFADDDLPPDVRPPRGEPRGEPRDRPRDEPRGGPRDGPPGTNRPPPPGGRPAIANRLQIVDVQGRRLGGPVLPEGRVALEEPVLVNGQRVATVRLLPSTELQSVDARFLQRQYTGLALAAVAALLLSLVAAWFMARWLARPLTSLQRAAQRIAQGELGTQVPPAGSREMAQLITDVNHMAAELKRLEGARRSWIAHISHELRTPLSVLLGELESVQDGVRQPTPAVVALLRDEVLQLVRLVNDLHMLSMADLGALPYTFSEGDANAALTRCCQRFAQRAASRGLQLDIQPALQPLPVRWDFGRIDQLMGNLLENSLRYTDALADPSLNTPGQIQVRWQAGHERVVIEVSDSPPAVREADLAQLFEPLFRADAARQRAPASGGETGQTSGSGLGLAICRAIVQAHQGRISAHASPLGGLSIRVDLPVNAKATP